MKKKICIFIFLIFYSSSSIAFTKKDFSNNQLLCPKLLWGFEFISSNKVKVINTDLNKITTIKEYYYDMDLNLSYINIFSSKNLTFLFFLSLNFFLEFGILHFFIFFEKNSFVNIIMN